MTKKFEFTGVTQEFDGTVLHQIRALRELELSEVKPGDVGGWLEHEGNLSHEGDCWVYPGAVVRGRARVEGDSRLHDQAVVEGNAVVRGFTLLHHDSTVKDDAVVEDASLSGYTTIYGHAHISCGEDGPQIIPGIAIDFDVRYGLDYVVFGFSYAGYLLAVSQTGRLCLAGGYGFDHWAGSLPEFKVWAAQQFGDDPEIGQAAEFAEFYLRGRGL